VARRFVRLAVAATLLSLAACSTRTAGKPFETVELVHQLNGKQDHVTVEYAKDGIRYVDRGETTLLRYADRRVWSLDDEKKTVRESSLDSFLKTQKAKTNQPDLPDLDGASARQAIQVEETSQRSDFGGVPARLVRIRGEGFDVELWLANDVALPGPRRETFELLQALGGTLALPAIVFDHLPGFPVRSTVHVSGGMFDARVTRSLLSFTPRPIGTQLLEIPSDYRRIDATP